MAAFNFRHSITSVILRLKLIDTAGLGKTGITNATANLKVGVIADVEPTSTNYTGANLETIATLGTYAAPSSLKVRIKLVDDTYHPGIVELHIADARFAVANAKSLIVTVSGVTGMLDTSVNIDLTNIPANVRQIDQLDTNGNNATLFLKQFNVQNNAGDAILSQSTGGNGHGFNAIGHGSGSGLRQQGGATGNGSLKVGGSTSGAANLYQTSNGIGLNINASGGSGVYINSTTHAIQLEAGGSGHGIRIEGGSTGNAIHLAGVGIGLEFASTLTKALGQKSIDEIVAGIDADSTVLATISSDTLQLIINTAAILDDTGTTGVPLRSDGFDNVLVDGVSGPTALARMAAMLCGEVSGARSGIETFTGWGGTVVIVSATSVGNRTSVNFP